MCIDEPNLITMKWNHKQETSNSNNLTDESLNDKHLKKQYKLLLKRITVDDLELLATDGEDYSRIDEIISTLPEGQRLKKERDRLLQSIKECASNNWAREPSVVKCRVDVTESIENLQKDIKQIVSICKKPLDDAYKRLQEASLAADASSEKLLDQLYTHQIQYDEFVPKYIEERKLYHARRMKAERIRHYIEKNLLNI